MNNRLTTALAVGGGYLLGRTKKAKFALGVATMVMGKRMQVSPQSVARFATEQLARNPQFKQLGDQLRTDLRGAGRAATGALVNRQVNALADRLHERTLDVRDQLAGVGEYAEGTARDAASTVADTTEGSGTEADDQSASDAPGARASNAADKSAGSARRATGTAKKTPAKRPAKKRTASRAPAKQAASSSSAASGRSRPAKRTGTGTESTAKSSPTRAQSSGAKGGRSRG
ncbi:DNA primase [Streptomyces spirodelae]|uniref:DNA primase n=1 Tax=Streptomyces spirodelae TaxID=2812904 RepID=A0ABS3WR43_9ACTN|nr:DNA primase [Streptomyces spirodelae]MBO8185595.1 DNA primase [Streptomyces spirodelae]